MPHLYLLPTNFIAASVRSISTKLPTSRGFLSPSTESSTGMIFCTMEASTARLWQTASRRKLPRRGMAFGNGEADLPSKTRPVIMRALRMGHQKYTEEQVIGILREGEGGAKVQGLCRKYGVSDATYHRWKAKYAGLTLSELKRLKTLEEENRRTEIRAKRTDKGVDRVTRLLEEATLNGARLEF